MADPLSRSERVLIQIALGKVFWTTMRGKRVGNAFQPSARAAAGFPRRPAWILVNSAPNKNIWAE